MLIGIQAGVEYLEVAGKRIRLSYDFHTACCAVQECSKTAGSEHQMPHHRSLCSTAVGPGHGVRLNAIGRPLVVLYVLSTTQRRCHGSAAWQDTVWA